MAKVFLWRLSFAIMIAALFALLPSSSRIFACMGCEMSKYPASTLAFSPDGKLLAATNPYKRTAKGVIYSTTVELWQAPKLDLWKRLPEKQSVYAIAFSPDGKLLAVGGKDGFVSLWKLPEGKRMKRFRIIRISKTTIWQRLSNYIRSLAFSPDGKLLAAGTGNGEIYLWELPKGNLVSILSTKSGLGEVVVSVAFSADNKKLTALLDARDIQVWQLEKQKLLWEQSYDGNKFQIVFSPDGQKIIAAGYSFLICDTSNGKVITKSDLGSHYSPPGGISPGGQYVAMIAHTMTNVKVYRISDFRKIWQKNDHRLKLMLKLSNWVEAIAKWLGLPATNLFTQWKRPFAFSFAFSRDNKWLALGFDDGSIRLWRIQ